MTQVAMLVALCLSGVDFIGPPREVPVKVEPQLVLYVYCSGNCTPCQYIREELKKQDTYAYEIVEGTSSKFLDRRYSMVPTIEIVMDGKVVGSWVGYKKLSAMKKEIDSAVSAVRQVPRQPE